MDPLSASVWGLALLALAVVLLPGAAFYLLVDRFLRTASAPAGGPLLTGIAPGVALWPLALLYTTLIGARFTPATCIAVLVASALAILILLPGYLRRRPIARSSPLVAGTLLVLTVLDFFLRLNDIKGLSIPLFGDSLHHTMITQIITETGRVPSGYEPFVPVQTFTYHFGFHTLSAVLSLLTGVDAPRAVLVMGQALITLALPASFVLGRVLLGSDLGGLLAGVLTGFVSAIPGYYVNWGRYTQLAGMVLLAVALALLYRALTPGSKPGDWLLAALGAGGLVVVHYRILIFYGLFAIALAAVHLVIARLPPRAFLLFWARGAAIVFAGIALALPWIANLAANYLPGLVSRLRTVSPDYIASYNSFENFRRYVGLSFAATGVAGVLGLALPSRRATEPAPGVLPGPRPVVAAIALWVALLLASMLIVPGAIGSFTVATSVYLPLSVLGAFWLARALEWLVARFRLPGWSPAAAALLIGPIASFALGTLHLSDPATFGYLQPADEAAFTWIRSNTPANAKFEIGSEFSYAGRGVTATDGGMWLPVLAARQVSVPALAAWTEEPVDPDFFTKTRTLAALTQPVGDPTVGQLVALGRLAAPRSPGDPHVLDAMKTLGVTHVYSGAPGGRSVPRLNVAAMRADPCHYRLIYPPTAGVYIFEVNYSGHGAGCK